MGDVSLQIDTPPQLCQRGGFADEIKLIVMTQILILNASEIFTTTSPLLLSHAALHCVSSMASPSSDCANSLGRHGVLTLSTLVLSASLERVGGVLLERFCGRASHMMTSGKTVPLLGMTGMNHYA